MPRLFHTQDRKRHPRSRLRDTQERILEDKAKSIADSVNLRTATTCFSIPSDERKYTVKLWYMKALVHSLLSVSRASLRDFLGHENIDKSHAKQGQEAMHGNCKRPMAPVTWSWGSCSWRIWLWCCRIAAVPEVILAGLRLGTCGIADAVSDPCFWTARGTLWKAKMGTRASLEARAGHPYPLYSTNTTPDTGAHLPNQDCVYHWLA